MPRIKCPGNPDCYIDCPGSGYAYYNEPYGPCESGCNQDHAGNALIGLFRSAKNGATFSGIILGVTTGVLASFARDFESEAPLDASYDIATLKRLDIFDSKRRIKAFFVREDVRGVIQVLAEAATGSESSGRSLGAA